jgi:hypothetical protein
MATNPFRLVLCLLLFIAVGIAGVAPAQTARADTDTADASVAVS